MTQADKDNAISPLLVDVYYAIKSANTFTNNLNKLDKDTLNEIAYTLHLRLDDIEQRLKPLL